MIILLLLQRFKVKTWGSTLLCMELEIFICKIRLFLMMKVWPTLYKALLSQLTSIAH